MIVRYRFWVTVIVLLPVLAVFGIEPALAHAVPVSSNPQPNAIVESSPAELTILFNEPVVLDLSRVQVLTQAGQALDVGPLLFADDENRLVAVALPALNDGAYLVSWQVLSAVDGHTTSGTFSFGVGEAELTAATEDVTITAQLSPLSATARWMTLTAIALLLGLFGFRLFVWNPMLASVELEPAEEQMDRAHARVSLRLGTLALVLVAIALVLIFIDQSRTYSLWQPANFQTWMSTRFGTIWLVRFFWIGAMHFALTFFINVEHGSSPLRGWAWWAGMALSGGLALTSALISHSAALSAATLEAVAIDFAHTVAAGLWAGGLVALALALWQARRLAGEARSWLNLSLIINFSGLAAIAVGILMASGVYLAWRHVGTWSALAGTAYGLMLLAKIGIALLAFAIAGANLLFVKPRLYVAYEEPDSAEAATAMRRFGRLVRAEAALALLVLVAAGILTDLQRGVDAPPLRDAPGRTVVRQTAGDLDVQLTIEPALVGQNTFDVLVTDSSGEPVTDEAEVSLRYTFLGQAIGAASGDAEPMGDGRYRLEGSYVSLAGPWQVEVSIRRPDTFDTFAPFRLEAGLGGNIRPLEGGTRPLEQFARFMTLAGGAATGAILVLFAIGWGFLATRAAKSEWQLIPLLAISIFALWLGASQLFTFFDQEYTPSKFLTNPVLPDVASIAAGEQLYSENCIPCHGPEGRGNGPVAATLSPPPADFTSGHTDTHTDGDLYYWIQEGIEGSPMPAFGDKLTDEEMWHLVNYVRRLSSQANQVSAEVPR